MTEPSVQDAVEFINELGRVFEQSHAHADAFVRAHSRQGTPWFDAPLPHRLHRCRAWTSIGPEHKYGPIERCACGASNFGDGWTGKNESRR